MHCGTVFAVGTPRNSAVRILLMVHGVLWCGFCCCFLLGGITNVLKIKFGLIWQPIHQTEVLLVFFQFGCSASFFILMHCGTVLAAGRALLLVRCGTLRYGYCCWYAAVLCSTVFVVDTLQYGFCWRYAAVRCGTVFAVGTLRYAAVRCGTLRYGLCCWYAAVRCVTILVLYAAVRCGTLRYGFCCWYAAVRPANPVWISFCQSQGGLVTHPSGEVCH